MNVEADVYDALCTFLADSQPFSPPLRIAAPGVTFAPRDKEVYLAVSFMPNRLSFEAVGKGDDIHVGIFQVSVVAPPGAQGIVSHTDLAGSIVQQFKKGTRIMTADNRRIKISRKPTMAGLVKDGVRPLIPVSISYEVAERNYP